MAQKHIGKGVAGEGTKLAKYKDVLRLVQYGTQIHRAAHIQDQQAM